MSSQIIGIDIGGTKIEGVLVDQKLRILKRIKRPTEAYKSRQEVIQNILDTIAQLQAKKISGIGIGVPGYSDRKGRMHLTPNIPSFEGFGLKRSLERKLGCPIALENDAHCFLLAEHVAGAAKGYSNILGLTIGTGIGGGAILDGKLYKGKDGAAGHFGHMIIDPAPQGPLCRCGRRGDVEAWCSGRSLEERYLLESKKNPKFSLAKDKVASKLFRSRDKITRHIINQFYEKLGVALSSLAYAFNPQCIVLGGSISDALEISRLKEQLLQDNFTFIKETKIIKNKLGGSAGVLGAACLVMPSLYASSSSEYP